MKWRINAITALYIKTYKQYYGIKPSNVFIAMAMAMPADKLREQIALLQVCLVHPRMDKRARLGR